MQVRYFVHHNGTSLGPMTFMEIEGQLNMNRLFPTDFVYVAERSDWVPMLEFIMVHGPKEKVMQPVLQTLGARSPADDHVDMNRFASGVPAALGTSEDHGKVLNPYPSLPAAARLSPAQKPPPPPPKRVAKPQTPPPPLPKSAPKPFRRPTPATPPKVDATAKARVDVMPQQATRLAIQITGSARVGEELEILVTAQTEEGLLDHRFNEVVQIACDRPLAGLGPLHFVNGTARLRVQCLTQGSHEFSLILNKPNTRELTSQAQDASELEDQGRLVH